VRWFWGSVSLAAAFMYLALPSPTPCALSKQYLNCLIAVAARLCPSLPCKQLLLFRKPKCVFNHNRDGGRLDKTDAMQVAAELRAAAQIKPCWGRKALKLSSSWPRLFLLDNCALVSLCSLFLFDSHKSHLTNGRRRH
jgi:hypothetical protein